MWFNKKFKYEISAGDRGPIKGKRKEHSINLIRLRATIILQFDPSKEENEV